MIRRITVIATVLSFVPFAAALADDVGDDTVITIQEEAAIVVTEQPVTAAPPPFVELQSTAIGAGIGARFGDGTLLVEGVEYPFKVKGLSLGDLGVSRISAEGLVANLENVSDFEGRYLTVEAGAAAGVGVSTVKMRNGKGVVITLESDIRGLQLTAGAGGLELEFE